MRAVSVAQETMTAGAAQEETTQMEEWNQIASVAQTSSSETVPSAITKYASLETNELAVTDDDVNESSRLGDYSGSGSGLATSTCYVCFNQSRVL